jgi:peptidoglycan hydrolase-like protein with peptidoglycan-binding domain
MKRKAVFLCIGIFLSISLSGCANLCRQKDLEVQGLKNRLLLLVAQNQQKDEEINSLKESLTQKEQEATVRNKGAKRIIGEVKSRPNIRQIQLALQNAGYDPGIIDAKMGKQTRLAVEAFQKANGLVVDGKVGKKTWDLLQAYLYKKD